VKGLFSWFHRHFSLSRVHPDFRSKELLYVSLLGAVATFHFLSAYYQRCNKEFPFCGGTGIFEHALFSVGMFAAARGANADGVTFFGHVQKRGSGLFSLSSFFPYNQWVFHFLFFLCLFPQSPE
jgi:hypothetical protein